MNPPRLGHIPKRVVSLVPSLTESLFDLGLGGSVVGITDYCTEPAALVKRLPRVGGTKDARQDDILALHPDLVIANQEENTEDFIGSLQKIGVPVWLTFPKSVGQALDLLWDMAELFDDESAQARVRTLEMAVEWTQAASVDLPVVRYFCPIWQDQSPQGEPWWMTFNAATYPNDILSLFGGENIFASRLRRYPLDADLGKATPEETEGRDVRYPRVTTTEIRAASPDVILLPSEPYTFSEHDRDLIFESLSDTPAVQMNRIFHLDGSLITWYGTRMAKALDTLNGIWNGKGEEHE